MCKKKIAFACRGIILSRGTILYVYFHVKHASQQKKSSNLDLEKSQVLDWHFAADSEIRSLVAVK